MILNEKYIKYHKYKQALNNPDYKTVDLLLDIVSKSSQFIQ